MKKACLLFLTLIFGGTSLAHQFTPTYPRLEPSLVENVLQTDMRLFNKRKDVEYYELQVFDKDWNRVGFAAQNKLIHIKYLEYKDIRVYIRKTDREKAKYICTMSKIKSEDVKNTTIASRICSKIK